MAPATENSGYFLKSELLSFIIQLFPVSEELFLLNNLFNFGCVGSLLLRAGFL